ncbi:MAG: hypothetical protein B6242_13895 [Anaerolineaceae bacterium 4572_78]|nr:MAG: hypothetical protein B6242_13895 [Anaerolineaceae bacterium 4572_78]
MKIDSDFYIKHILSDGTHVRLRHVCPEDAPKFKRGFEAFSPESRYLRFFSGLESLSDNMLQYLTNVDGYNHVAIVALVESVKGKREYGVGVARFVRIKDEPNVAEIAVSVIDNMHNKGLGRLLLKTIKEAAIERDIQYFRAEILASNEAVQHILQDINTKVIQDYRDMIIIDIPLGETETGTLLENNQESVSHCLKDIVSAIVGIVSSSGKET